MTIEVDATWGGAKPQLGNVSAFDELLWLARSHGYHGFLKVPCRARTRQHGSMEGGSQYKRAAWLLPLSDDGVFVPTGYAARRSITQVQDLLLVQRELAMRGGSLHHLAGLAASDCTAQTSGLA